MNEIAEQAHETIHEHGGHGDPWSRRVAVLVAALAAILAMTELGAKSTQNEYLTHHIAVSDDYAYYQARNLRSVVKASEAQVLESLPNASDPAVQARIKDAEDYSKRMLDDPKSGDGMKQLLERVRAREEQRNEAFHHYHIYEYAAGVLEIAIVLASVAVITRTRNLAIGAGIVGGLSALVSLAVALGMV